MGLTDAVVAVAIHPLTRVPVVQVHVAWAVGAGTRAELWEVTGVAGVPARRPCWFQLEGENKGVGSQQHSWDAMEQTILTKPHIKRQRLQSKSLYSRGRH